METTLVLPSKAPTAANCNLHPIFVAYVGATRLTPQRVTCLGRGWVFALYWRYEVVLAQKPLPAGSLSVFESPSVNTVPAPTSLSRRHLDSEPRSSYKVVVSQATGGNPVSL